MENFLPLFCIYIQNKVHVLQENAETTETVEGVGPGIGPAVIHVSGVVPFDSQWLEGAHPSAITESG